MTDLIKEILKFRNDRDWEKFHDIKSLLIGLNIEVAELQEIFLWKKETEIGDSEKIENELSDIFIFLVYIADHFKLNLEQSVLDKIKIHKKHYPINLSKGVNKKYTELKPNTHYDENNF